jgi:hypothetical protein
MEPVFLYGLTLDEVVCYLEVILDIRLAQGKQDKLVIKSVGRSLSLEFREREFFRVMKCSDARSSMVMLSHDTLVT